jgi:hypothetical protein
VLDVLDLLVLLKLLEKVLVPLVTTVLRGCCN